jgi:hypothetical protein
VWQRLDDSAGERRQSRIGGRAAPAKRKGDFRFALDEVETLETIADGGSDGRGINHVIQLHARLHHLEILARQQVAWAG